jgi:hypothetical protein
MDEKKVVISFRIDVGLRDLVGLWAKEERRTLANFMEDLIHREQERRDGKEITLEDVYRAINTIKQQCDKFSESKKRNSTNKEEKLTAYDVWEDCGVCKKESWDNLIKHYHEIGLHLNYELAKKRHFNKLRKFREDKWDCEQIIEYIIEGGWKSVFVPNEWIKEELRFNKNR